MARKSKIREELFNAFAGAVFPIMTEEELLGAFPCLEDGTICLAEGSLSIKKDEKTKLKAEYFPLATPEQAVELLLRIFRI